MANLPQDGVPDATLESVSASAREGTAENGRGPGLRNIILAVRLRTRDSVGAQADISWAGDSPAAALCTDVISASSGAPESPQGAVLRSRFFSLQSALLTVRRLQWAVKGLEESAGTSEITALMAIYSPNDAGAGAVASLLEKCAPGQVLIGSSLAEAVQQLPNADLGGTRPGDWREFLWRTAETPPSLEKDEESLLGLIRALGREDPVGSVPEAARSTTATPVFSAAELSEGLGRSHVEPEPVPVFTRFKWLIVGGAVAVVVLIAALVIPGMVSGNRGKSATQVPEAPAKTAPASPQPAAVPPSPAASEKPRESRQLSRSAKLAKAEVKAGPNTEAAAPKVPAGTCDLTEADIPRSLNRAESYMYAGKLAEAQAMFQRVLGCPSAHDKALEGLQRVRQRMAAQSH